MKVLVVGSGGREHALAWKAAQSEQVEKIFVAPGNAGTASEPHMENISLSANDQEGLLDFAAREQIGLTIIGPEDPLAAGIVDRFMEAGLPCFGPGAGAAQMEGSKAFAKDFMIRHGVPTAAYGSFTEVEPATEFIRKTGAPIVIKADGLAAGKGVVVAQSVEEAEAAVHDMLAGNAFGEAGHCVVVEEFLQGEEASFIVMADGKNILPLATSQDHKAVGDGDQGLNTGGMGAYSPAPVIDETLHKKAMEEVIEPTVRGLAADGFPFTGFLYAGLMVSPDGDLGVLEFNVRFGDPETQPVLMRLKSDLVELCLAAIDGRLDEVSADWDSRAALGVVLAAEGYPEAYAKGFPISGIDEAQADGAKVFHAGTSLNDGQVVTTGGRVLCVTALGDTVKQAQASAYDAARHINWDGVFCRSDIGYRAIARENS
jgi:phosphoribosylamine--glycine ligase